MNSQIDQEDHNNEGGGANGGVVARRANIHDSVNAVNSEEGECGTIYGLSRSPPSRHMISRTGTRTCGISSSHLRISLGFKRNSIVGGNHMPGLPGYKTVRTGARRNNDNHCI